MLGVMQSGGWLMAPILLCSVAALAIGIERGWALHRSRVLPKGLLGDAQRWVRDPAGKPPQLEELAAGSPLGRVLAAGIANARRGRSLTKEAMAEAMAAVSHDLERYLTALGIIASIAPLLGLLGTVVGMIQVFSALMADGAAHSEALAGGISEALITTAAGLTVAIPSLMLHRFLLRRVDDLVVELERQAAHLAEALHGGVPPSDQLSQP